MKILHTADWHLGKRLDSFSRMEEQVLVMDEICQIADQEQADMVLVAGDLFDAFNPPTEATELLYRTLKRLTNGGKRPVIAIAGNHDSPALIDAPDPLAKECGILLIGYPKAVIPLYSMEGFSVIRSAPGFIELKLNHIPFPVRILHTPYSNEARLQEFFGTEKDAMLNQVLTRHWQELADTYCDEKGVNILCTHLFMARRDGVIPDEPEGEKPIRIGNADLIFTENIPGKIQYTALGHLHNFQNAGSIQNPAIYASSPLQYSFSEAGQQKYVVITDILPGQQATWQPINLIKGRKLIRKSFNDIDLAVQWLKSHPDTLIELTIESDSFLAASDRQRLFRAHDGIIHIIPKVQHQPGKEENITDIDLSRDIRGLFADYFKTKNNGQEPDEAIMQLFNEILQLP